MIPIRRKLYCQCALALVANQPMRRGARTEGRVLSPVSMMIPLRRKLYVLPVCPGAGGEPAHEDRD